MGKNSIGSTISYFFLGEYFSDALRTTITVVLPIILFFYLGNPEAAKGIGVGALLISLTDLPDNRLNKLKTALSSIIVFFATTLVVSSVLDHVYLSAVVVVIAAFGFSMFGVYGQKLSLIGTMALIVCTFVMGLHPERPLYFSSYILVGGIWYYVISLIQILLRPYRSLHHAIFECLMSSAMFLNAKAKNYDIDVPLDLQQKEAIKLHIKVNQKHELIRNLLLTDKYAMNPNNPKGQLLLERARLLIDLYEQLNAVHYDYALVRKTLGRGPSLKLIASLIGLLAKELEQLGRHVRSAKAYKGEVATNIEYYQKRVMLLQEIEHLNETQRKIVLKVVSNMNDIVRIIEMIRGNERTPEKHLQELSESISYPLFVTGDRFSIREHLTLKSPIFRFSLRLAICFLFGFLLIWQLEPSKYSYWLFLTLVIVARPKFSITWKRNLQRLKGSLGGVAVGLIIIYFVKSPAVLLSFSVVFLLGFYAFNRLNYTVSVLFITPAVILTLGSYQGHFDHIVHDRIIFTVLGCVIAIFATYLFPIWDSRQLKEKISKATKDSLHYLQVAIERKENLGGNIPRMARKNANLSLSALSEAIESASQEPMRKHIDFNGLYGVQSTIYQINAIITSIYLSLNHKPEQADPSLVKQIISNLSDGAILKRAAHFDAIDVDHDDHSTKQKLAHIAALSLEFNRFSAGFRG
ncbi:MULTISPECIES: FUSC family membrane protein [unclassified Pedobacter]|uniref:FUSC family protein n=1 Tax=unclassified Pedobacter TaxID=2628915 RepID=UPI001DFDF7E0|nr:MULTISPECIES: FUSC family membrane protein [unclassified Pedobacter]CAH0242740.1 Inner membrane protein YccS [Pedobacter sp. Bi36]CAH0268600.1 Inner membrane protein YccS [Pedobacter sp. Bi126]